MNATDAIRIALNLSYEWTLALAEDLADAPFTEPTPGGNPPMWIVGHISFSNACLLAMIDGEASKLETWQSLFAGGTQPSTDPTQYPDYGDVLQAFRDVHAQALAILEQTGDAGLDEAPPAIPDFLAKMPELQTKGKVLMFVALHQIAHRGQLADARRVLGRKPMA
ncbi:DinB family protein [Blastopirellula marina]|nr:DinB family protein [Blastopirellula marina]